MMIAGAATLMPSDRLPCEGEGRPLSAVKQEYFFFFFTLTTHLLTLVYTHSSYKHTRTNKETNKTKVVGVGGL